MFCITCRQSKNPDQFWSIEFQRHVARCQDCRNAQRVVGMQIKRETPKPARVKRDVSLEEKRDSYNSMFRKAEEPNIRLIADPKHVKSIKFVVDQLR